jgi:hypothetical protein
MGKYKSRGSEPPMLKDTEGLELKIAKAIKTLPGTEDGTVFLPLDAIEPICKIMEPVFYEFVKNSIKGHGLYHPLVVVGITVDDWNKEAEMDVHMSKPIEGSNPLRWRIQCGCNRYFALKELGYDAVECIVMDDVKEAQDACHMLRIDKRWQRGSNWEQMHGNSIR